jgi:molecular chaperone GrpE
MNDIDTTYDPPAGDAGPEDAGDAHASPDPLADLRRERDELEDRWLRQTAEFDNYRKRMDRERRDLADHAASEILHELLPVLDDIERALEAAASADDPAVEAHRQGLELIERQFSEILRKRHVSRVEAVGQDFDPNVHQAVGQEVSEEHREGEVIEELRRGYTLKDRLLRPAMVKVATRG